MQGEGEQLLTTIRASESQREALPGEGVLNPRQPPAMRRDSHRASRVHRAVAVTPGQASGVVGTFPRG